MGESAGRSTRQPKLDFFSDCTSVLHSYLPRVEESHPILQCFNFSLKFTTYTEDENRLGLVGFGSHKSATTHGWMRVKNILFSTTPYPPTDTPDEPKAYIRESERGTTSSLYTTFLSSPSSS
jgi:hypothetical protein